MTPKPAVTSRPKVSEGRIQATIEAIGKGFIAHEVRLLDVHSGADHHRSMLEGFDAGVHVIENALGF